MSTDERAQRVARLVGILCDEFRRSFGSLRLLVMSEEEAETVRLLTLRILANEERRIGAGEAAALEKAARHLASMRRSAP